MNKKEIKKSTYINKTDYEVSKQNWPLKNISHRNGNDRASFEFVQLID